jgi:hypothetical protein
LQAIGFGAVAVTGIWASLRFTLATVVLFCLVAAIASGLAKLAVDASIQERIPEAVRASAFAHAETLLMLAWVSGGALGLIPLAGRVGVALATAGILAATARGAIAAWRLRDDILQGRATPGGASLGDVVAAAAAYRQAHGQRAPAARPDTDSSASGIPAPTGQGSAGQGPAGPGGGGQNTGGQNTGGQIAAGQGTAGQGARTGQLAPVSPKPGDGPLPSPAGPADDDDAPPGYHIFRPSPPDGGVGNPR